MSYTFTVREIVEAARKNGLVHARGQWFGFSDGKLSGCIMGQAFYNLTGLEDATLADNMASALNDVANGLGIKIIGLNDRVTESGKYRKYSDLVRALERGARNYLDEEVTFDDYVQEEDEDFEEEEDSESEFSLV